jgi:hypothetical protein
MGRFYRTFPAVDFSNASRLISFRQPHVGAALLPVLQWVIIQFTKRVLNVGLECAIGRGRLYQLGGVSTLVSGFVFTVVTCLNLPKLFS